MLDNGDSGLTLNAVATSDEWMFLLAILLEAFVIKALDVKALMDVLERAEMIIVANIDVNLYMSMHVCKFESMKVWRIVGTNVDRSSLLVIFHTMFY